MYESLSSLIVFIQFQLTYQSPSSLKEFLKDKKYSKDVRPFAGERPASVHLQLYILKIGTIDEQLLTYKISYILRQTWTDPRLARNSSSPDLLYQEPAKRIIWVPNVNILNSDETEEIDGTFLTKINNKGDIYNSGRFVSTCHCPMDLRKYPMDTQVCPFRIETYAYSSIEVNLSWHEVPIQLDDEMKPSGYSFEGMRSKKKVFSYYISGVPTTWDMLQVDFTLKRIVLHVFYRTYLPIILVMVFNIGSYWIPDSALPARCALIMTTFLTATFILQNVSKQSESSTGTTALQFFITFTIVVIVVAICEYLVVLYLRSRQKLLVLRRRDFTKTDIRLKNFYRKTIKPSAQGEEYTDDTVRRIKYQIEEVHIIDRIFRYLIPGIYIVFCAGYFGYYQSQH